MKRPPEGAISEGDLRQRIVQLERIVEQQTSRIAELEQELARRKGRSRRGAQTSSSQSVPPRGVPMPPAVAGPRGARRADSPGTKDTAARGYRWSRWTNGSRSSPAIATDAGTG